MHLHSENRLILKNLIQSFRIYKMLLLLIKIVYYRLCVCILQILKF